MEPNTDGNKKKRKKRRIPKYEQHINISNNIPIFYDHRFFFPQDSKIWNAFNVGVIMSGTCFMNANIGTLLGVAYSALTIATFSAFCIRLQEDRYCDRVCHIVS